MFTMKVAAVFVASIAATSAFAPSTSGRSATVLQESLADKVRQDDADSLLLRLTLCCRSSAWTFSLPMLMSMTTVLAPRRE